MSSPYFFASGLLISKLASGFSLLHTIHSCMQAEIGTLLADLSRRVGVRDRKDKWLLQRKQTIPLLPGMLLLLLLAQFAGKDFPRSFFVRTI